jgi:hypothetical protein
MLSLVPLGDDEYQIIINGDCLTVYGKDKVLLKPCNTGLNISDSQRFATDRIQNPQHAKYIYGKEPSAYKPIAYPYNIFRSKVTGKCLIFDNNNVILGECTPSNIKQQWKISPNENICL